MTTIDWMSLGGWMLLARATQAVQDEFQSRSGKPCSNRFAKALTKRVLEEVRADPVFQERSRRGPRHVYSRAVVEEELAALEALMPKLGVEDGDEPEGAKK
jgi:hypothetical protein